MSPDREEITLVVDGVEVRAAEGAMLVDAAKGGDVEIPVFCYEPKLGQPVGACRMCLVEVEGIPKLQTACSTPVRDGMVVYTQTDRVKEAQNAVVEFLLVNHPLDCPVCDKGGECPLQDIAMGWGPDRSRFTDPKRHFQKPIPLSPLVKIDRERCILCYRCVRFSQEVAEDEQLQLLERGSATYVGTFDDRPYIAPFHGNIIELCPVGALTSEAYRFRARPWDIEDAGSICTLCPSQCNVKFTVRDERVQRVLARDNKQVDDGWLCDKGRFGFQMIASDERITRPLVKGEPASWDAALNTAAEGLRAAGTASAAIVGGATTNEEGYLLQRIVRQALGSPHVDTEGAGPRDRGDISALADPELGGKVSDLDSAEAILVVGCDPLHSMPILDLRIRKAVRRTGARLAVATDRPTALDGGADETARYEPGNASGFLHALAAELQEADRAEGDTGDDASRIAGVGRPGSTVIVWGERMAQGPAGHVAVEELLACARALRAKLIGVPDTANGRGLREVGCLPGIGPGLSEAAAGKDAETIRGDLEARELSALILAELDPVSDLPGGPAWESTLTHAPFVVAVSSFHNSSTAHADVVFPAEAYAEKEGTLTHPDGRLQRLRPNVPRAGDVRPMWQVLCELAARLGHETGLDSTPEILEAIASEVPFYAGITLEEIGGQGIRWQDRDAATSFRSGPATGADPGSGSSREAETMPTDETALVEASPGSAPAPGPSLRAGSYRDLWSGEATVRSPALRFLAPEQRLELAPDDAERLGLARGDEVDVRSNGTSVRARVAVRERIRPGAAFLIEGLGDGAASLSGHDVEITEAGGE
jgi:NADH-quinone oxidoreductase subunit G